MNVIARLEFELVYFEAEDQHITRQGLYVYICIEVELKKE